MDSDKGPEVYRIFAGPVECGAWQRTSRDGVSLGQARRSSFPATV